VRPTRRVTPATQPFLWLVVAACSSPSNLPAWTAARPEAQPEQPEPPATPTVLLNELQARNASTHADEALDRDDWVELIAVGPDPVPLDGWSLSDDVDSDGAWTFPAGTVLEPGAHLVVWLDGQPDQGPLHADFRLAGTGETLALLDPSGAPIDTVEFGDLGDDLVLGRFPDGAPAWEPSIRATPGNRNPADPGRSLDPSDALFSPDQVLKMELFLDAEQEAMLRANPDADVRAGFAFAGATFQAVSLRIKGAAGSRRTLDQKAAFKIDLNDHEPGRRLRGLEHLTLNNMVQDPSCAHETLSYDLMRTWDVPAPRTAHVELYLNGVYRGLYLHVETIDDTFLARWFTSAEGNLYEGAYGADVTPGAIDWMDQEQQGDNDVTDRSDLIALTDFLQQPPSEDLWPELQQRVDTERLTRALAAEVLSGHWDGYFYYPNNYRLYHDPTTDQWTLLPSGTDQTFSWWGDPWSASGQLARFCLGVPSCELAYRRALWDLGEALLDIELFAWLDARRRLIAEPYERDPYREASPDDQRAVLEETFFFVRNQVPGVLGQLFPGGVP
jgi:hypothetical protein